MTPLTTDELAIVTCALDVYAQSMREHQVKHQDTSFREDAENYGKAARRAERLAQRLRGKAIS